MRKKSSVQSPKLLAERFRNIVDEKYGGSSPINVDLMDIYEICRWYVRILDAKTENYSDAELYDLAIELEVQLTMHLDYHLKSFRKEIKRVAKALEARE